MLGTLMSSAARASRSARVWRGALLFVGALGLAVASMQTTPAAHASAGLHYQRGYYLDNGWYCYGWANGDYRCTAHWHRASNGALVSDNTAWVPNNASTGSTSRGSTGGHSTGSHSTGNNGGSHNTGGGSSAAPSGIGPWVSPRGYSSYAMSSHGFYSGWFGWCTWYAAYRRQDEPLMQLGNAAQWAWNAASHGLHTGYYPAVGATVVFQPGVQGASGGGHVGHVEAVYSNGWFLISEMSFYWNGGGWGRVSYRYVHTGSGVSFIY